MREISMHSYYPEIDEITCLCNLLKRGYCGRFVVDPRRSSSLSTSFNTANYARDIAVHEGTRNTCKLSPLRIYCITRVTGNILKFQSVEVLWWDPIMILANIQITISAKFQTNLNYTHTYVVQFCYMISKGQIIDCFNTSVISVKRILVLNIKTNIFEFFFK